jgi:hypothetical protein
MNNSPLNLDDGLDTSMAQRYPIRFSGNGRYSPGGELFPVLERLLPVCFRCGEGEDRGEIVLEPAADSRRAPSLAVPPSVDAARQREIGVAFADDPDVPFPYRGRSLSVKVEDGGPPLALRAGERVLAASGREALWSVSEDGAGKRFRSALPLPRLGPDQNFGDRFNGERFLEMLPLLQFLRETGAGGAYRSAPLRAGYIIDDPNLHWPRYGFVDYRAIADHARRENYHVAFATIPLDAWFTHAATAELFRRTGRRLSLLVHGNDHAKEELARNYPGTAGRDLLRQAVRRIERLERRTRLRVCRVMVPPHGACSEAMLAELARCGFEAACISAGSLRAYNGDRPWTRTLGYFPGERIAGCPVLPRWGLGGNVRNTLLAAAYLGQPLILRGHHQDLRDGVEVLDEYARFVNGLGDVFWSNMTDLCRRNYLWRRDGGSCRLIPLGTRVVFEPPEDVTDIVLESFDAPGDGRWRAVFADGSGRELETGERFSLPETGDRMISVERVAAPQSAPPAQGRRGVSAGLVVRRFLTEARDRLLLS